MESNTALWRATLPRRYSHDSMCRLGAAMVLRSACTPAAVTLEQTRRSREVSAGRMLNARSPAFVTLLQPRRSRNVSAQAAHCLCL
jgi:hypothetical protein